MKPLLILLRMTLVGLFWSVFFIEGIRVIMLTNWHFDIFRLPHWQHAWNLWISGWVIDEPKEWAFVLIILTSIPVWITVWAALSSIRWGNIIRFISLFPLKLFNHVFEKQVKKITSTASVKAVKKKKSYKEIRPRSVRPPLEDNVVGGTSIFDTNRKAVLSGITPSPKSFTPTLTPTTNSESKEFTHSLFEISDNDSLDFDLFEEASDKTSPPSSKESPPPPLSDPKKKPLDSSRSSNKNKEPRVNSSFEIIKQKGYEVITGTTIKNTFIDFIGISQSQICLCLNDKEPGDWLADEERFNDEEPLWFSESSHRISPVRKISLAYITLEEKLKESDLSFEITPFVIEQIGNIINAEDMFDIWKEIGVKVTRIDRGSPKEIPLFAKILEKADGEADKAVIEKIKKILRSIV